jgi:hypothetical protein
MNEQQINADYLIVGAGAMGLAFVDVMLTETEATFAIIDKLGSPGGHWNHAYPFVRLHQPSYFYGVNSIQLGENRIDMVGRNKGMMELACGGEVAAYFDNYMRRQLLTSGRVQYFPQCAFDNGEACSIASGRSYSVNVSTIVDATYMNVKVPQVTPPSFPTEPGVNIVPPNALTTLNHTYESFVVIGAGKTACDTCLFLLDMGVDPNRIVWIKPRESWLNDRKGLQPEDFDGTGFAGLILEQAKCVAESESLDDMFNRLEASGSLLRIDQKTDPTMYRCATVSRAELEDLRKIQNVVRLGRVQSISPEKVMMDRGELKCHANSLFINCSADGLERRPTTPIFADNKITLQAVRPCQQSFSAAMIGYVESMADDITRKNELCRPTPHPDSHTDFLVLMNDILSAQLLWASDAKLLSWLLESRLDAITTHGLMDVLEGRGDMSGDEVMGLLNEASGKAASYLQEANALG